MSESISYELTKTQKAIRVALDKELHALGITTPQYGVLAAVHASPGASAAELARRSFHAQQTINEVIANLETVGFIERHQHPTHGRIRQVNLTPAGERILSSAQAAADNIDARLSADMDDTERTYLLGLLRRCAATLQVEYPVTLN